MPSLPWDPTYLTGTWFLCGRKGLLTDQFLISSIKYPDCFYDLCMFYSIKKMLESGVVNNIWNKYRVKEAEVRLN